MTAIDNGVPRDELIEFARELIRTPSVNGEHPEEDVARVVADFATSHRLDVETFAFQADRPNLVIHHGPDITPDLVLVAHLDTVPTGDVALWDHPPFEGVIAGGRLHGRGAVDNKSGIVAAMAALLQLRAEGFESAVQLICVPDEESGASGTLGVSYLHSMGRLKGTGAIYTYPGMDQLEVGHRGVTRMKLTAHGEGIHTGSPQWQGGNGVNALTSLAEILLECEQIDFPFEETPLFSDYKTVLTPTLIEGGSGPSIVPDLCTAHIDVRLVPSVARADIQERIAAIVAEVSRKRPGLEVETEVLTDVPPTLIDADEPIVTAVRQASQTVLGVDLPLAVSGPANESYLLNGYGLPTCIYGPTGSFGHATNEYVDLETIFDVARVYAQVARNLELVNE